MKSIFLSFLLITTISCMKNSILTENCDEIDKNESQTCNLFEKVISVEMWQVKKNRDVTKLVIHELTSENLPVNLADSFPNLLYFKTSETHFRVLKKENVKNLKKLEELSMNNGQLIRIRRDAFDDLENLKILEFNGNLIKFLPTEIFRELKRLEVFSINDNEIEELNPRIFKSLPNLRTFTAENNQIAMIASEMFASNRRLQRISMSGNNLRFIDANVFANLQELSVLNLRNNDCIDKEYTREKGENLLKDVKSDASAACHQTVKEDE